MSGCTNNPTEGPRSVDMWYGTTDATAQAFSRIFWRCKSPVEQRILYRLVFAFDTPFPRVEHERHRIAWWMRRFANTGEWWGPGTGGERELIRVLADDIEDGRYAIRMECRAPDRGGLRPRFVFWDVGCSDDPEVPF